MFSFKFKLFECFLEFDLLFVDYFRILGYLFCYIVKLPYLNFNREYTDYHAMNGKLIRNLSRTNELFMVKDITGKNKLAHNTSYALFYRVINSKVTFWPLFQWFLKSYKWGGVSCLIDLVFILRFFPHKTELTKLDEQYYYFSILFTFFNRIKISHKLSGTILW